MSISYDSFLNWAESRFYDVVTDGDEIKINSIFKTNDQDHKMWCNPTKGPLGAYHCWKTEESGNLIELVMEVDGIGWPDAAEILGAGGGSLADLYQKVEEFFKEKAQEATELKVDTVKLELPTCTYLLTDLPSGNPYRQRCESYLNSRCLSIEGLCVCAGITADFKYRDRLVIPYYDRKGKLIYFNCRTLKDAKPKYKGPPKELGIGKHDVIYMPSWAPLGSLDLVFLTEGELDALSIFKTKLLAAALGGKAISGIQIDMLANLRPVIAFDRDDAGRGAFVEIGDRLLLMGKQPYFVLPPRGFKDWNELLVAHGDEVLRGYIEQEIKLYDRAVFLDSTLF